MAVLRGPGQAARLVVSGRVQGVGFRWFVVESARDLGLVGWVRNLEDGRVDLWAEGPGEALDALERTVRQGPRHARVERVERSAEIASGEFRSFDVRG